MTGQIKGLNAEGNYGFIYCQDDGKEYFFHVSGLQGGLQFTQLRRGMTVTFDGTMGQKGPRAENITAD